MHNLSSSSSTGSPCFSEKIVPVVRVGVMRVDDREKTKGSFPMSREGIYSQLLIVVNRNRFFTVTPNPKEGHKRHLFWPKQPLSAKTPYFGITIQSKP